MKPENQIKNIRRDYLLHSLLEEDMEPNPIQQFENWWKAALQSEIVEPNAMTLATCDAQGKPSARIVLLKDLRDEGFVFFTNYESRKGREIEKNPFVSLVFFWKEIERQVRIQGEAVKIDAAESDAYFASRPRESRIGAWSSPQSEVITRRKILEENVEFYKEKFGAENIPRPGNWGGYLVRPDSIEFWQGGPGRLHDRLHYHFGEQEKWIIERLAP